MIGGAQMVEAAGGCHSGSKRASLDMDEEAAKRRCKPDAAAASSRLGQHSQPAANQAVPTWAPPQPLPPPPPAGLEAYFPSTSMPLAGWMRPCTSCRQWTSGAMELPGKGAEAALPVCARCQVKVSEYRERVDAAQAAAAPPGRAPKPAAQDQPKRPGQASVAGGGGGSGGTRRADSGGLILTGTKQRPDSAGTAASSAGSPGFSPMFSSSCISSPHFLGRSL